MDYGCRCLCLDYGKGHRGTAITHGPSSYISSRFKGVLLWVLSCQAGLTALRRCEVSFSSTSAGMHLLLPQLFKFTDSSATLDFNYPKAFPKDILRVVLLYRALLRSFHPRTLRVSITSDHCSIHVSLEDRLVPPIFLDLIRTTDNP